MITYELAKELKDAGFPLDIIGLSHPDLGPEIDGFFQIGLTWYRYPILSELIEACGEEFKSLNRISKDGWIVYGKTLCSNILEGGSSQTPEEAVARLWLAINKK